MSTIHVDPEALRNLSRLLDHQVHQMLEEEYQLKIAAARLEMVWTGGSAQDFMEELQYFQKNLHGLTQELYLLAIKLVQHSQRWEESDLLWQALFRDLYRLYPRMRGEK
ncbi:MAG TPA: hypothetical protein PLX29_10100 [Anaerolineaceae bacterium]|jgi:uncharacterized protein YukE|nr:hypothetical protein [Anaerolineaceae bacterium]HQM55819.1 hypothetical protein [Anaerolineaceae bacterium]